MDFIFEKILAQLKAKYAHQSEYLESAEEVLSSLTPVIEAHPEYQKAKILERFLEPERIISFQVVWSNDKGETEINRGYRVQFNSAIGPYKGGLRFHPSVNESILKFLGLEQTLKNSLTGLPMGGAKGGSDFDPKGKSDHEIMTFCQAFMTELYRHIGEFIDVPAGDIGVGPREIGYLYGQYRKITGKNEGVLTGKGLSYGGSLARKEATGYGLCYFAQKALNTMRNASLNGKTVIISGSGNVAIYACEKAQEMGAKVIAMSDSNGVIFDQNGIDLDLVKQIKEVERGRISEYAKRKAGSRYLEGSKEIWNIPCDVALPCATQNEIDKDDAVKLIKHGLIALFEGANMPCSLEASRYLIEKGVLFGPAKAANAGGVATSGFEMTQNAGHAFWTFEEVDKKLKITMEEIFDSIYSTAKKYNRPNDLLFGANLAGFEKVADAMYRQGY